MTQSPVVQAVVLHSQPLYALGIQGALTGMPQVAIRGVASDVATLDRFLGQSPRPELLLVEHALACGTGMLPVLRRAHAGRIVCFSPEGLCTARPASTDASLACTAEPADLQEVLRLLFGARLRTAADELLTPRQLDIARLVAEGNRTSQIAAKLYISEDTVKTHLAHIFRRLNVRSRVEIARWWHATMEPRASAASMHLAVEDTPRLAQSGEERLRLFRKKTMDERPLPLPSPPSNAP